MSDLHLSPSEASRKLGVSVKALRLYERHALVKPLRAANGWRAYGPAEMARLHQVLALKNLGLSLQRIGELLAGQFGSLEAVLALQEELLSRQADRLGRALALLRQARVKLATGQTLSVDDLANLTAETAMTNAEKDLETIFKPLINKHFSESEQAEIAGRRPNYPDAQQAWQALIAEANEVMAKGDPTSPEAADLARRWKAMVESFTGGDPVVTEKVKAVWQDAFADPQAAPKLPATPAMFAFIHQALQTLT